MMSRELRPGGPCWEHDRWWMGTSCLASSRQVAGHGQPRGGAPPPIVADRGRRAALRRVYHGATVRHAQRPALGGVGGRRVKEDIVVPRFGIFDHLERLPAVSLGQQYDDRLELL